MPQMERETGIEPASLAWKARVLPLNYSRQLTQGAIQEASNETSKLAPEERIRFPFHSKLFNGGEGWIRTSVLVRGQIYSLLPLTTRPPLRRTHDYAMFRRLLASVARPDGAYEDWFFTQFVSETPQFDGR